MEELLMSSKIETKNLSAWFGENQILRDVNLKVEENAVTAIIGPSGCGKSTFLRCLNRMHELVPGARVSGKVILDGTDIYGDGVDPVLIRRKIGMVFQKPNPFPTMSIFDNVSAGLRLNGVKDKKRVREIVEASLKKAALWEEVKEKLDAPGVALSGGQQQRLCIARALAVEPEVILMDEPASSLDPVATTKIEDLILDLKKEYTIVIVTHNMQEAARISDYTAFIYLGKIIEFGPTSELFENPKEKQTQDYLRGVFG
jgi:phosphate transport system ATP-binding protein